MYQWTSIVKSSIVVLTLCIIIEIFAGQLLQGNLNRLLLLPILLLSIPVVNGVGGNVGSVLGARLASGLHVGSIEYSIKDKQMRDNVFMALGIGMITYGILAILIYYLAVLGDIQMGIGLLQFTAVILGTGFLLILMIAVISVLTAFWSFKRGLDPDNMVAPVVTTVGDTLGILFLFIIIGVVGL